MGAKFQSLKKLCCLTALGGSFACTGGTISSPGDHSGGSSTTPSNGGPSSSLGGSSVSAGGSSVSTGGTPVDTPGMEPSMCAESTPASEFSVNDSNDVAGPFIVLSGTLPPNIKGSPVTAVEVNGSERGVRIDAERSLWSYFLAHAGGNFEIIARAESGAMTNTLSTQVTVAESALPERDIDPDLRMVGTWMFTWFTGDPSWQCSSAWRPPGGFRNWDGTVGWARDQLLDQIDAHIDAVGLQLDTPSGDGNQGYRFDNVINVVEAARGLLEEGVLPPRLFPFLDTAIISDHYNGALDLSTNGGRAYLYQHAQAFYSAARAQLGSDYWNAGTAQFNGGKPAVGFWHSVSMSGVDNAAVLDFKARFSADFAVEPYFIAHPNDWRNFDAVDEITQMVGPPEHFHISGRDAGGFSTINVEAGFWNPTSNTFYLPREGGVHYGEAWQSALAERQNARHVWIDTWNETGEGSGIFAAEPLTYSESDSGPCDSFVNRHDEAWGSESRHYINVTRGRASAWNDAADLDAEPLASDAPTSMRVGEQRYVTVVMRNIGDLTWAGPQLGLTQASADADFHIASAVGPHTDALIERFSGVARGLPGVFTVLVTAPCTAGTHTLELQMIDGQAGAFGQAFSVDVAVTE